MTAYPTEIFKIRGRRTDHFIGEDKIPDFFLGNPEKAVRPTIFADTTNREAGRNIVAMFDDLAIVDIEGTTIKVGTNPEHRGFLVCLEAHVRAAGCQISPEVINEAVRDHCETLGIQEKVRPNVQTTTAYKVAKL